MSTSEFIVYLQQKGIELWIEGDALRFRAPPGHLTPELRTALKDRKEQLLEHLRSSSRTANLQAAASPPEAASRFAPFPLTDIQNAYWVGRQGAFDEGGVAAHSYLELAFDALDLPRLENILQRLIEYHDMLRMVVLPTGEQAVLEKVPPFTLTVYDLAGAPGEKLEAHFEAIRAELSHQVLPTDRFPLFDVRASKVSGGRVHLHISFDLLTADAFSVQILIEQCASLYRNPEAPLVPFKRTFRDYCLLAAQRADPGARAYQKSLAYWRGRLEKMPNAPDLPLVNDTDVKGQHHFVRRKAGLDQASWRAFRNHAKAAGITASMALCAAYGETLRAFSRSNRLTLNLTLFNRLPLIEDVERIVGDFTSGILLELDGSKPESFAARARRLQGQLMEDLEHSAVSSVKVLREAIRLGRWDAGTAMPYVFTSLISETGRSLSVSEGVKIVDVISQTPQVWLDHQVFELDGGIYYSWDSVDALFPAGLIEAVFETYGRLLRRLSSDASAWDAPSMQPLLPAQMASRAEYNATERPVSSERIESLFLRQAERQPEAVAVISGEQVLSYGDLERRSARIAAWLTAQGAKPGQLVAIVAEKGVEQVVAALAILRAGAAYLPLSPSLPSERLHGLLEEARAEVVLTQSALETSLRWPEGLRRLAVDRDELLEAPKGALSPVQGNGLAYVIYTSGSTGRPKGVMIDHRGAVNTLLDMNERFQVGPQDRVLALSSLSFDLSVYDIFGALAAGGAIVMPEPGTSRDPGRWQVLLEKTGVTIWNSVPALMDMLIEFSEGSGLRLPDSLRLVLMSGDWIPVTLPGRIRALSKNAELVSLGGATEASIWSILYRIGDVAPGWRSIPYGRPMVNQRFYVLDEALEPCPDWVAGQMYIGGIGLSLGYYRDPVRTAERFIIHPKTGERLYATGDLGRFMPDGNIEFLGREDFQVKIQGYRIELGEIEAALDSHPSVRSSVVNAVGKPGGTRRLVAYVVPGESTANPPSVSPPPANTLSLEAAPKLVDEYSSLDGGQSAGLITDPVERLEFKLKHHNLRPDAGSRGQVQLKKPEFDEAFRKKYMERQSAQSFLSEPVSLERLSELLSYLMPITLEDSMMPKYRYASAGGLYPVQVYLHVKPGRVEGLAGGTYYYHPKRHELVLLTADAAMDRSQHASRNRPVFDAAAFSVFLVGKLSAIQPLYGSMARDFCMLEAGYIAQLLMSAAPSHKMGLCPIGVMDFEPLRSQLALDEHHVLLHSFLGGGAGVSAAVAKEAPKAVDASLPEELKRYLASKLPEYMVPSSFVMLESLPLTSNGKVDRSALHAPVEVVEIKPSVARAPGTDVERSLAAIVQEVLHLQDVDVHRNFFDLGGTSVHIVQMHRKMKERLKADIPIAQMFRYTTVSALAEFINSQRVPVAPSAPVSSPPVVPGVVAKAADEPSPRERTVREEAAPRASSVPAVPKIREAAVRQSTGRQEPIAIVGMSGRFPGAKNLGEFWRNLRDGVESVSFLTERELRQSMDDPSLLNDPNYVRASTHLEDVEFFDADLFGFMPKQARITDPQHRIFMECVWEAIEDAGYNPRKLDKLVGVYAGAIISNYLLFNLGPSVGREGAVRDLQTLIGNDKDYLATHVSYKLGLKGPSLSVQSACSTSLVAVHLACQALVNQECDMALAGGVSVRLPQKSGYLFEQGGILSPDGHCRAFDANAQGTIFGSGAGVVVLKRLSDALADGDNIRAVIRGSAINNDGSLKIGYTAPSQDGQAAVISAALAAAGVSPSTLGYIETHGTGTPLGDQIELSALQQVFGSSTGEAVRCPIGSVKTNVGHLEVAAGIAGLIKTVLSLQHRRLPPSLNFKQPNPQLESSASSFYVNTQLSDWPQGELPRRAGVSSFGIGGTNAHVVLEEAPERGRQVADRERPLHVLSLSARSEVALKALASRYAQYLASSSSVNLADMCHTANVGRAQFTHRLALVAESAGQLSQHLALFAEGSEASQAVAGQAPSAGKAEVVFLFTGQGGQQEGMGRELYETQPTFRESLQKSDEVLKEVMKESLLEVLYGSKGQLMEQSSVAQPALFAVEYALAQLWMSWGVKPAAVMGHSLGEYVAACVAGMCTQEEGLRLVAARGRLMQQLPEAGEMVAVLTGEGKVREAVAPYAKSVSVAAVNGPEETVVSGRAGEVEQVVSKLKAQGVECRKLKTTHAFHSPLMEPMLEEFEKEAKKVKWKRPEIELVSNVSGREAKGEEASQAEYWRRHVREPVKYWEGLKGLYERGNRVFVEVGPKPTLVNVGKRSLPKGEAEWVGSLKQGSNEWQQMLGSVAKLYVKGVGVDWAGFDQDYPRAKVALPTYPFQRERYWIERSRRSAASAGASTGTRRLLGRRVSSPTLKETVFESFVSTGALPFIDDHRVNGAVVLPATVYMELAQAAAAELFGAGCHTVEGLLIQEALVLQDEAERALQLVLTPRGEGEFAFQLFSTQGGPAEPQRETSWMLHTSGTIRKSQKGASPPKPLSLEGLLSWCAQTVPVNALYESFEARGITYGATFRGIERLQVGRGEALGWIQLPEELDSEAALASIHPALLDACLQVCGATRLEEGAQASEDVLYLPVGLKRFQIWQTPGRACWSHVSIQPQEGASEKTLTGSVRLLDVDGAVCAEIEGLQFRQVSRAALQRSIQTGREWTYDVSWEPRPRSGILEDAVLEGTWWVLADSAGIGTQLAEALQSHGARCVVVRPGSAYEARGDRTFTLDPARVEDFERLLVEAQGPANLPCRGILHLWGLDEGMSLEAAQERGCRSVLNLAQALGKSRLEVSPRLWIMTRGTQRTGHETQPPSLTHSALWGLGRTLGIEHPELSVALLDLDEGSRTSDVSLLMEEFLLDPDGEQVAFRDGRRYVSRLARCAAPNTQPSSTRLRDDVSYLLTGGLGALGLHVARWMVERGARHLVVMGRKEAGSAAQEALKTLRQAGAQIRLEQGDVSQPGDVARVLAAIAQSGPPLRGVMHMAGVVEDSMLQQQDWPRFKRVLAPKLQGSWNLHQQTKEMDLDFFVLFSSSSALLGAAGQGNYAAANAFLDSLAHHRRALGLKAVSINWGPWSGGGMAASFVGSEQRRWVDWIEPAQGLELLGWALETGQAQVAVLPVDWAKYFQRFGEAGTTKFLSRLLEETRGGAAKSRQPKLLERLKGLTRNRQQDVLLEYVYHQVTQVLGLDPSRPLAGNQRLFEVGMDSLLAVELRNRFQSTLGVDRPLSSTLVFDHPTVEALTGHLATEFLKLEPMNQPPGQTPEGEAVAAQALATLEQLPQNELGSLLDEKLALLEKLMGDG
ncbi:amino acid adenylation domain-containing protein [Stigmatella sp. ncwal1]|uniref:Amino acid adenylation domain-containing protein n=1 Tax=Stigmatella ashevillensis TaxID=2995309 RepID=A0ABT5D1L6_9BACT|nr:non-ribosomal peptide synthetase/type I polyketide synthase [Stigmatella ashevillena]MDC0707023.1 amino acid adenylation domain-containing protein [Stigmatella ashevillena]